MYVRNHPIFVTRTSYKSKLCPYSEKATGVVQRSSEETQPLRNLLSERDYSITGILRKEECLRKVYKEKWGEENIEYINVDERSFFMNWKKNTSFAPTSNTRNFNGQLAHSYSPSINYFLLLNEYYFKSKGTMNGRDVVIRVNTRRGQWKRNNWGKNRIVRNAMMVTSL